MFGMAIGVALYSLVLFLAALVGMATGHDLSAHPAFDALMVAALVVSVAIGCTAEFGMRELIRCVLETKPPKEFKTVLVEDGTSAGC